LVRRCHRERQALAVLRHPGIVDLRDAGVLPDGRPFLVTSFVAGQHLDVHCREQQLDARAIALLMLQVCLAVQHAHDHGIVHRDLKPANILVTAAGAPVVLDFGVARLLTADPGECTVTAGGAPLTPYYASPELLLGLDASPHCDVFALGIVLRDALAATAPARSRRLQRNLDIIVRRSTSTDPLDRHGSAGALALDLQRSLAGQRLGRGYLFCGALRRHRRAACMAAVLTVGLALAAANTLASAARARTAKAEALSVSEFLVRLLDQAGPQAQGASVTVPMALRAAEELIPVTFAGKPDGEARVRMAYGRAYMQLGDWARAAEHLRCAIALLQTIPDAYPESITYCRQLLERCQRSG
ncbi:MAG TPA: serine/threonine-protein kinase, partial [Planctomycetota bacterium]|nr:serine/threonine-protein kinase [Planctomycetota bacterium]